MGANSSYESGVDFSQGRVLLESPWGDLEFQADSVGTPELTSGQDTAYSTDVTLANASEQQCQSATTSAPDADPITDFHAGLFFCVDTNTHGIALVEETKPLDSSNTLYLKETFWPNAGT
jgi:hypothetical protein